MNPIRQVMTPTERVIFNTSAQYFKTFVNILFTLYSTRLILQSLGESDFGTYSLLAGVIAMLAFATNALASTTQRFLSYHQGKSNVEQQKGVFATSFYIHIALGLITAAVLLLIIPLLFNGFLNIPAERIDASKVTYCFVTLILLITFVTSPFRAVLISHENIIYLSTVDILDGSLKVVTALALSYVSKDKLIMYSVFLFSIHTINLLLIGGYCIIKYEECIIPTVKRVSKNYVTEISSFAGWNIYSVGCIMGRTQGVALVINKFFGTAVNAAYGLGFQIGGYVNFMSESLLNAIRPQIIRSEGEGNRPKVLLLSELASKYSFFLLSCLAVPCIVEMPTLLKLWLNEVPDYAVLFCRMVLMASIVDSITIGLGVANQAIGDVKQYSLVVNSIKLITLPVVLLATMITNSVTLIAILYVVFEFICAIARVPFVSKTDGLNIKSFSKELLTSLTIPLAVFLLASYSVSTYFTFRYSFLLTFIIPPMLYIVVYYLLGMSKREREIINNVIKIQNK